MDLARLTPSPQALLVLGVSSAVLALGFVVSLLASRTALSAKSPAPVKTGNWPILGAYGYFQRRWDFMRQAAAASATGHFGFHVGKHAVVGVTGTAGRKLFFDSRQLDFAAGYSVLFQGGPDVDGEVEDDDVKDKGFNKWFSKTLIHVTRRERLVHLLPLMLRDARGALDALGPAGVTDPFDSIYTLVYHMSMRIIGPAEIAGSPPLVRKTLGLFDTIQDNVSSTSIIAPWLPTPTSLARTLASVRLLYVFQNIIDQRRATATREADTTQELIDSGASALTILKFTLGALFAAQVNTSINSSCIMCYLAVNPEWRQRCYDELVETAAAHCPPALAGAPLVDQLAHLPDQVWDQGLPLLYLCLKESIRLQMVGTAFRRNSTAAAIPIPGSTQVIAPGEFVVYPVGDTHLNPEIFTNPLEFDPGRFLDDRKEDQKVPYAWLGWGAGRHPCLGMRTARFEYALIAAHFLAMFDFELRDARGRPMARMVDPDLNGWGAAKPAQAVRLHYTRRDQAVKA